MSAGPNSPIPTSMRPIHRGAEIVAGYKFQHGFEVYGSATRMRRELVFTTFTTTLSGVPDWAGRAGLRYDTTIQRVNVWTDAYIRGATHIAQESSGSKGNTVTRVNGWTTYNLEVGGTYKEPVEPREHSLSVALTNLGNKTYRSSMEELSRSRVVRSGSITGSRSDLDRQIEILTRQQTGRGVRIRPGLGRMSIWCRSQTAFYVFLEYLLI